MKRPNKYRARKTPCGQGHIHDSAAEAKHCDMLFLRVKAKEIKEYFSQYDFDLLAWSPLFSYGRKIGKCIIDFYIPETKTAIEVKGKSTEKLSTWRLKRKILEANNPDIKYQVVK